MAAGPVPKAAVPPSRWPAFAAVAAALAMVLWAYGPAFHGGQAPIRRSNLAVCTARASADPLNELGVGVRPAVAILMFSYWLNARISGADPYSYHVFNVGIHCTTSALVFAIVRRFLEWSGVEAQRRDLLAAFAGLLFLLHPVQIRKR